MASMRRLNRQLHRWTRYARRAYWNPRVTRPAWMGRTPAIAFGHQRVWDRREAERERRRCFLLEELSVAPRCLDCGLTDPYRGQGDGIGSCECPRCEQCGAPPEGCDCAWHSDCPDPDCDCCVDDDWDESLLYADRPVETVTGLQEAGLL
jgi:hypothetical protein